MTEYDWRDSVKKWRVESFFGKWIVVPDGSDVFCYISRWRWLAMREAERLAREHGGEVV
jgi:hypothetical protein